MKLWKIISKVFLQRSEKKRKKEEKYTNKKIQNGNANKQEKLAFPSPIAWLIFTCMYDIYSETFSCSCTYEHEYVEMYA